MNESKPSVNNYLVWNILATLFCCLPCGIVGIFYSSKVNSALARGDYDAAQDASSKAKTCLIVGVVCAVVATLGYLALGVLGAAAGA